ncbi:hypothetical protein BBP40_010976 [Aspergillus hancockii]|nr:hypothetical protein BBP40_010976 [Aspergillus hancockii]
MAEIFRLFLGNMRPHLSLADLANLARVSHGLNDLVTPYLYHTVRFHSPGRLGPDDRLMLKLDIFGDPRFDKLDYTKRVIVSGSWYEMYAAIDSELGQYRILSPAARMLSNIISNCVLRMPNLEEFIWDMQVSMTQFLLTTVMMRQNLMSVRLRMGTDSTPKPFFRPALQLYTPVKLRAMHLIQVDDATVLQSLSSALRATPELEKLSIWADERYNLSVSNLFETWDQPAPFHLHCLDLRGFADLGMPPPRFWEVLPPQKLRELTLELGARFLSHKSTAFWDASIRAELHPGKLTVNLGAKGIVEFLDSFSGLEALHLLPSEALRPIEPLPDVIDTLKKQHYSTLKALGICLFHDEPSYYLWSPMCEYLVRALSDIEELRLGQEGVNEHAIEIALSLPQLRVVRIDLVHDESANVSRLLNAIILLLQKGAARKLKYVAFDDDTVYEILRDPIRVSSKISRVGYVHNTFLLTEEVFDWVKASP